MKLNWNVLKSCFLCIDFMNDVDLKPSQWIGRSMEIHNFNMTIHNVTSSCMFFCRTLFCGLMVIQIHGGLQKLLLGFAFLWILAYQNSRINIDVIIVTIRVMYWKNELNCIMWKSSLSFYDEIKSSICFLFYVLSIWLHVIHSSSYLLKF